MKFPWNKRYTAIASYVAALIAFAIVLLFLFLRWDTFGGVLSGILNVCKPLIYAVGIAYLLWPILRFFEEKVFAGLEKKKPRKRTIRTLSLICTYIVFLSLLVLFFGTVSPQIADSILTLRDKMTSYINTAGTWVMDFVNKTPFLRSELATEVFDFQPEKLIEYVNNVITWVYDNFNSIIARVTSYATNFALEIKNILLGIIFSVYFLLFKEHIIAQLRKLFVAILPTTLYEKAEHYVVLTDHTFGGFINGKLLDSLIIGILCFFLMSIFRMPYAPLVSMIVGITNVIPFFGPFIGAIPSAFIIFIADPGMTLWFCLLAFLLQQLDGNVIGPKILGDFIGLSPLWIIVSITVMGGLFGVFGMFLGVPTFAVLYAVVKELTENRLSKKELATDTDAYYRDNTYLEIVHGKDSSEKKEGLHEKAAAILRKRRETKK